MDRAIEVMMNSVTFGDDYFFDHTAGCVSSLMMGRISDARDRAKTMFFIEFGYLFCGWSSFLGEGNDSWKTPQCRWAMRSYRPASIRFVLDARVSRAQNDAFSDRICQENLNRLKRLVQDQNRYCLAECPKCR